MATTNDTTSPKQVAYITSLRTEILRRPFATTTSMHVAQDTLINAVLGYSLPAMASTSRQASALIESYKDPITHARSHLGWAQPILDKLQARFPTASALPVMSMCEVALASIVSDGPTCEHCGPGRQQGAIDGYHAAEAGAWIASLLS